MATIIEVQRVTARSAQLPFLVTSSKRQWLQGLYAGEHVELLNMAVF